MVECFLHLYIFRAIPLVYTMHVQIKKAATRPASVEQLMSSHSFSD